MSSALPRPQKRALHLLVTYLGPLWVRAAALGALLLVGIGLELIGPRILRQFVDDATAGVELSALLTLAVLFVALAVLGQLVSVVENYVAQDVGLTATNRLRADLVQHCLRLDPDFHSTHTPGELIERIDGDVTTLGNFFSRFVIQLLGNGLLLVGVVVLLFAVDWRAGLAMGIFAACGLLLLNALRDVAVPAWEASRQASAELYGFLEERLAGTEDIRANGATAYMLRRLHEHTRRLVRIRIRAVGLGVTAFASMESLGIVGIAVALGIGAYLYQSGAASIGTVFLLFSYAILLNRPVQNITRQLQDLQQALAGISRVSDLLAEHSTIQDPAGEGVPLPSGPLAVEFDRVRFGYRPNEPVLRDVSVRLEPGQVLGLLGRTGGGKTTITRLLFRLYDPQEGAIRLSGVDLRHVRLNELRRRVGMVTQDVQLFHASVRDNLTIFDRTVADERILEALAELGLLDWYRALPDGLDTTIAPGGGSLSAGEAQLLAFARVFLKDPGLVILDEASSRLDTATERQLERAVDRLLAGRTAIVIAHRLATVERADSIMILEDGRIVEEGRRLRLAEDPSSRFRGLLRIGLDEVSA
jgi:ATP-binding cassette, subfamily B, bacterial